jgi:putative membrane protein
MNKFVRWGAALVLLPLAACNTNASNPMSATVPQPMPAAVTANAQDQNFAQQAAASDKFEIQSSQLALQRSRSRPVRAFAQRMIDEHTMSTQRLAALASAKGMNVPGVLDPNQQQMLASLEGTRNGFDRAYLTAQVTGHTATVAAYQTEIAGGYDADVKGMAQELLPNIQDHLKMAQSLRGR